jgi:hypothetical protein
MTKEKTKVKLLSEDTASDRRNYKKRVTAIAKEYGFNIYIFSDSYMSWGRINEKEHDAYFSGGPKKEEYRNMMNEKEQQEYERKYGLTCGEYDRFEYEESCHNYFKDMRDSFLDAYPEFK